VIESNKTNFKVRLSKHCEFDEENDNAAENFNGNKEFSVSSQHMRPEGGHIGSDVTLENGKEVEVWQCVNDQPYGW